ncbi:MAG: hypothetical protein V4696_01485 [Pseudomonadota bacterium]
MKVTPPPSPKKGKRIPEMARRMRAIESVRARFENKPYRIGQSDCAKLVRALLVAMGHKRLPKPKPYKNAIGAKRELKRLGFDSLEAMMDTLLPRIAPAMMLPGDIALIPADPDDAAGDETMIVSLGGAKFWGWHPDHVALVHLVPPASLIKAAWRA